MPTLLRDARPGDARFIAWVLLASHRSHLPRGFWDHAISDDEVETLAYLATLCATAHPHFAHHSAFRVAEVDAAPAAAMCGYFDAELGTEALGKGMAQADAALGRSRESALAGMARAASILHVTPPHEPGAWIVEHVATRPEFRRRGLVDRLLADLLERGRALGAKRAEIGVLIGNDPAQRAYEKAGFVVSGERRHPDFEAVYGCPGIRSLARPLP